MISKHSFRALLAAAAVSAAFATTAQAQTTFAVEGILESIDTVAGTARCNGTLITLNRAAVGTTPATVITSPTATLGFAQLTDPTPFTNSGFSPLTGQARRGFIGGTCIAEGTEAANGRLDTVNLFVEIAENVLVGSTTNAPGQPFAINGVQVVPVTDPRMPAVKPASGYFDQQGRPLLNPLTLQPRMDVTRNEFGFGVDLASVPARDLSSAEGYLGTDGRLYAHTIETTGGSLLFAEPRASIQRAQCRNEAGGGRDSIEIRGGCLLPAGVTTANVEVFRHDGGTATRLLNGNAAQNVACTVPAGAPAVTAAGARQGLFRYRNSALTLANDACPASLAVRLARTGNTAATPNIFDFAPTDAR